MIRLLRHIAITLALITLFTSCGDEETIDYGDFTMNFVTYDGVVDGVETFSFQTGEETPMQRLRTTKTHNLNWEKGKRSLIDYNITKKIGLNENEISINQIANVFFDSVRVASKDNIDKSPNAPIRLKSIWRTGNFLNIDCMVPYTLKARQFLLIMDESTWYNDTVELHFIQNIMNADTFFWRQAYTSFFIGNVWNMPTCKTLRVHLPDESYPVKYYDFKREIK